MIILSFNYRGFASTCKKLALKNLIKYIYLDFLMLQETLGNGESMSTSISKMMSGWPFVTSDAEGRSGGFAMGFKYKNFNLLNSQGSKMVLGAKVYSSKLCIDLSLINIYGSRHDRVTF